MADIGMILGVTSAVVVVVGGVFYSITSKKRRTESNYDIGTIHKDKNGEVFIVQPLTVGNRRVKEDDWGDLVNSIYLDEDTKAVIRSAGFGKKPRGKKSTTSRKQGKTRKFKKL